LIIGVTGNIACGKSTVDATLHDIVGATVIDADQVTHDLLRDDPAVRAAIADSFGQDVFGEDGSVERAKLGRMVFGNPDSLRRLEQILHPAVRLTIRVRLARMPRDAVVVVDAVKLLEGDLGSLARSVWWVTARPEQQLERLIDGRGLKEAEAQARLAAQPRLSEWLDRVNVIIDNSGTLTETRRQVCAALDALHMSNQGASHQRAGSEE
jgi:dephospho-CoA kinase